MTSATSAGGDHFGIGWRAELAAGIFSHLDEIDVVEVIADDYFDAGRASLRALRTLSSQVPIVLHGVGLGLASAAPADRRRLDKMARVVGAVEPLFWSEHLAFVRAGGLEIGHLAAPPRTEDTLHGLAHNIETCRTLVGSRPLLENVATLITPPGDRDEATWTAEALARGSCDLLLDLHNLHANATNFGYDPAAFLDRIPAERIASVHLAGGRWMTTPDGRGRRVLDDHLHDVPDPVYALLTEVGRRARHPLTVVLERDGNYPRFEELLAQLRRARAALARGRASSSLANVV